MIPKLFSNKIKIRWAIYFVFLFLFKSTYVNRIWFYASSMLENFESHVLQMYPLTYHLERYLTLVISGWYVSLFSLTILHFQRSLKISTFFKGLHYSNHNQISFRRKSTASIKEKKIIENLDIFPIKKPKASIAYIQYTKSAYV